MTPTLASTHHTVGFQDSAKAETRLLDVARNVERTIVEVLDARLGVVAESPTTKDGGRLDNRRAARERAAANSDL